MIAVAEDVRHQDINDVRKLIPKKLWSIVSAQYPNNDWQTCLSCIEAMAADWVTIDKLAIVEM